MDLSNSKIDSRNLVVTILAAGEGKRMKSNVPKVLCLFKNKPILIGIIQQVVLLKPRKIIIVTGKHSKMIEKYCLEYLKNNENKLLEFVIQNDPKGTGHAICSTLHQYTNSDKVLILNGDMPNITFSILDRFLSQIYLNNFENTIISINVDNPHGYGRIILNNNKIVNIIEEKEANQEEKKINLINTGIYCFDSECLNFIVPQIENNNVQGEYYLTDIVNLCQKNNIFIHNITLMEQYVNNVLGVNTKEELDKLEFNTNTTITTTM